MRRDSGIICCAVKTENIKTSSIFCNRRQWAGGSCIQGRQGKTKRNGDCQGAGEWTDSASPSIHRLGLKLETGNFSGTVPDNPDFQSRGGKPGLIVLEKKVFSRFPSEKVTKNALKKCFFIDRVDF